MFKIDNQEKKYLLLLAGLVLAMLLVFNFFDAEITAMNPFMQFLIMNMGVYFIITFLFKSIALDKKFHISSWYSSIGAVFSIIAIDTLLPEYHVTFSGALVPGGLFGMGASDYIIGYIGQGLGISGMLTLGAITVSWLWIFTYFVAVILLFLIAMFLSKGLIKKIGG
jgi:hypothetical protein